MRRLVVGLVALAVGLLPVACSRARPMSPGSPTSPSPVTALPTCPWAGGDAAITSGTAIAPADAAVRGRLGVLDSAPTEHAARVRAEVIGSGASADPPVLVRSRIVLVKAGYEHLPGVHSVPLSPDADLDSENVIATSTQLRTTDTKDHPLTLLVPAGLAPRVYVVVAVQHFTPQCRPLRSGNTQDVLGVVRVTR